MRAGKDSTGKERGAMWLNLTTWDKLAETVEKYAYKGVQVFVQGKLQICAYEDKQGHKLFLIIEKGTPPF